MKPPLIPLLILTSLTSFALEINGNIVIINNVSDFIELSKNVNNGIETYTGSTVVLGADIDFTNYSDKFEPVGKSEDTPFRGTFDGQGHTISNLNINSQKQFVGVFGVINGTSFKNLVVDASCSFKNTYNFSNYYSYSGGIIAYLYPKSGTKPIIENCVNMAAVTFAGAFETKRSDETVITITVGGIVSFILPEITSIVIRNCVNYGTITHSGHSEYASLGGILGSFLRQVISSKTKCDFKNCVNFGNIIHTGATEKMLGSGGITGSDIGGTIENCMTFSISKINNKDDAYGGKVIGAASYLITIKNCYWTSEEDTNEIWGYGYGTPTGENNKLVEANEETLNALNEWVESNANKDGRNDYSKWMVLYLNGGYMGSANANTSTFFTLNGFPIIDPTKEGHDFAYWCSDDDCSEGPATEEDILNESTTELYAMWRINNYTATFYLDNGTIIEKVFTYNETIVPPDMTGVKKFYGWNLTYERMPGFDLIIGFAPKPPKKSKAGAIAGGVVGGVAGVAIIVLIILFIVLRKTRMDENDIMLDKLDLNRRRNMRVVDVIERIGHSNTVMLSSEVVENPSEYLDLYQEQYAIPSISEALIQAGLDKDKAECAESDCRDVAKRAESEGALSPAFTLDDAAAVALYTYDFGSGYFEINPYMLLNKALASEDSADMQGARGLLYVVMCALRKLPRYNEKTLYRGLRESIDRNVYVSGRVVAWRRLTSTSTDMKAVKSFLDSSMNHDKSTGTLFVIDDGWGYNVQPYSLFPDEEEILLEPNRQFVVSSVIESDVTIVNLRMLDTPLVLPEIFGDGGK